MSYSRNPTVRDSREDAYSYIKENTSLLEYVESLVGAVSKPDASGRYRTNCPIHEGNNTTTFSIDSEKGLWTCFAGCGGGSIIDLYSLMNDKPVGRELLDEMAKSFRLSLPSSVKKEAVTPKKIYKALYEVASRAYEELIGAEKGSDAAIARLYIERRLEPLGDPEELLADSLVGFLSPALLRELEADLGREVLEVSDILRVRADGTSRYSPLSNLLTIPIRDTEGRVIGISGRVIPEFEVGKKRYGPISSFYDKYVNPTSTPVYDKSKTLFDEDLLYEVCSESDEASVVVVEGYLDSIALNAVFSDFEDTVSVALCGTALTEGHGKELTSLADNVFILTDNDEAGLKSFVNTSWLPYRFPKKNFYPATLAVEETGLDGYDLAIRGVETVENVLSNSKKMAYGTSAIKTAREIYESDVKFYRFARNIYKKIGKEDGRRLFVKDVAREIGLPLSVVSSEIASVSESRDRTVDEDSLYVSETTKVLLDFVLSLSDIERRRIGHSFYTILGFEDVVLRRYFGVSEDYEIEAISSVIKGDVAKSRKAVALISSYIPNPDSNKVTEKEGIGFVIRNALELISSNELPRIKSTDFPVIWSVTTKAKNNRGLLGRRDGQVGMLSVTLELAASLMNIVLDEGEDYDDYED